MYKIDTGQARTDLYGINKGAAQVLDLSPLREQAQAEQDRNFAKQEAEAKRQKAREEDIMTNLSVMGKVAIMPKDRELIAGKSQSVRDFVIKNIDSLKKGDVKAQMEYQNLLGDLTTSAEQSKNFREAWEQRGMNIAKEPDAYDQDVLDAHYGRAATEDAGNWNIDDSIYHKNLNYLDRVTSDLSNYAQKAAKDTPYGKTFTREEAEELIASDLEDPQIFRQATKDFNKATDKLGAANAVEYYKKKYAPKLVIRDTKAPPEYLSGSGGSKAQKIRTSYNKTGEGKGVLNWEYISPPDNPYLTTSIGDVKPGIIHDDGENTYMEVTTKPDSEGNVEKKRLGFQETADFVRLKLGTTLNELRKGNAPEHIEHSKGDVSKSVEAGHKAAEKARGKEVKKTVVKKGYNPTTNKTQLIYSDGSKEIVDGRQ